MKRLFISVSLIAFGLITLGFIPVKKSVEHIKPEVTITEVPVIVFELEPTPVITPPPPLPPTPTPHVERINFSHDLEDIEALARWFYHSCYKQGDIEGKKKGAWHIWNRVIDTSGQFADTVHGVIEQKSEYNHYKSNAPITEENWELAGEMLDYFKMEQFGYYVPRSIPKEYVYIVVNEKHDGYNFKISKDGEEMVIK